MDILTITRGILAISVVIWHSIGSYDMIPFFVNIPGRVAVWIFFGISGYVICYGFISNKYNFNIGGLRNFYINRLLKIYPLFIFLGLLVWATDFALNGKSPIQLANVPAEFLGFQFNQVYILNGPFWTLGIELQFYLIAPVILLPLFIFSTKKIYRLSIIFILYTFFLFFYFYAIRKWGWSFDGRNIFANLSHFLTGIFGCIAVYKIAPSRKNFLMSLCSTLALVILSAWVYKYLPLIFWSPVGIILVDVLIYSLIILHSSVKNVCTTSYPKLYRVFIFLGTISYGVYAWHDFIMKFSPINLSKSLPYTFFVLIPITMVVASLSYLFLERPFQKFRSLKR